MEWLLDELYGWFGVCVGLAMLFYMMSLSDLMDKVFRRDSND